MSAEHELLPRSSSPIGLSAQGRTKAAEQLEGWAWAFVTVLIFSGWFVVTRFSVTREMRFWDITALRFGVGALVLAPTILRRGSRISPAAWRTGCVLMFLWGAPFVLLVALGLQLTSTAQAATVAPTLMPVFAGVFAWAILREPQGKARWLGYATILSGLAGLVLASGPVRDRPDPMGFLALAAAAVLWAVYTLVFRRSRLTAIQAAALICVWSAVVYVPAYLLLGLSRLNRASSAEIIVQVLYQGILMSGVALIAFNRAVGLLGAGAATAVIALLPAVAAVLAIPILGETPTPFEGLAFIIIAAGVLLAATGNASTSRITTASAQEPR